ncbi:MAG: FAD-dependent oxidoreductase [Betaproteobacteria bacterium]
MTQAAKPKLIVIGSGMAATRTIEHLLTIAPDRYDITIYGAEPHTNYNRILLSPVLAGEMSLPEITLNGAEWYRDNHIRLHTGCRIVAIDRIRREVVIDGGGSESKREHYDRLLIATGSTPFRLPIPGADLPGVITYRDIADTEMMIAAAAPGRRAVVIGGGLLGLEAANGLRARGMAVTVVHVMPWLMERQLDRAASELLQQSLEARGIAFRLETKTAELTGTNCVTGIRFADGSEIAASLVVMAVGIRPNTQLAEEAGLQVRRGIIVDDTMQTFDPRIYAVGECVAHRGIAYGLLAPLYEMAKVAAAHLAHAGITYYSGTVLSTKLKVTGVDLFSAGNFMGGTMDGVECEEVVLHDRRRRIYKKLVLRNDRLVGGVLVGDTAHSTRYLEMIRSEVDVSAIRDELMFLPDIRDAA